MFQTSSVPIIRSYQLYTWQLVCFMQVMWPLRSSHITWKFDASCWLFIRRWRLKSLVMLRNFVSLQLPSPFSSRHRVTLQKVCIFTNAAMRTAGLTTVTFVSLFAINYGPAYNKLYLKIGIKLLRIIFTVQIYRSI